MEPVEVLNLYITASGTSIQSGDIFDETNVKFQQMLKVLPTQTNTWTMFISNILGVLQKRPINVELFSFLSFCTLTMDRSGSNMWLYII